MVNSKFFLKENYTSSNLYKKIFLLEASEVRRIEKGIKWTEENYPEAVLIGGTALVHYLKGGRNLTPDIDFLVDNISSLKEKLHEDNKEFYPLSENLGITVDEFNTDYLDIRRGNPSINKFIIKTAVSTSVGGYQMKIVRPELLAIQKFDLARNKDTDDGFSLITSKKLNKGVYVKLVQALKNSLKDYDSIASYAEML